MKYLFIISLVSASLCIAMVVFFGSIGRDVAGIEYFEWLLTVAGWSFLASVLLLWIGGIIHLFRFWSVRRLETNVALLLLMLVGSILGAFCMYFIQRKEMSLANQTEAGLSQ